MTGIIVRRKKRNRINNKERVDINAAGSGVVMKNERPGKNASQGGGKHNKDRFKKSVVKPEVNDEDVAKQVKETLARLTNKGKNKAVSIGKRNAKRFRTASWSRKNWNRKKAKC